jgi:hypothetical protein
MDSQPKVRASKFSDSEKLALTEAIRDRYSILFGKLDPKLTRQDKTKAWNEVLVAVNAVSSEVRSLHQVQEKYKNMKKDVKAAASHNNKEIRKTGGGKAELMEFDSCAENILLTIPAAAISGIKGGIDTSELEGTPPFKTFL